MARRKTFKQKVTNVAKQAVEIKDTVPTMTEWCATSRAVDNNWMETFGLSHIDDFQDETVEDLLFDMHEMFEILRESAGLEVYNKDVLVRICTGMHQAVSSTLEDVIIKLNKWEG